MGGNVLVDKVLSFATETEWGGLPGGVQHQAKRCLLDTLGCLLAGFQTPVAKLMTEFVITQYQGNEATILVEGVKASASGAALANGFAGNAFDIDDGHVRCSGHPSIGVLPGLLAVSQIPGAKRTGKDFLTAFVIGDEIAMRASLVRHDVYTQVYHASGSWVAIGIAGAAGFLLGLDKQTICEAMGIAEYHAPICPMMKCIARPGMGKDGIGWSAMVGVSSVQLANLGFTGVQPLFADAPHKDEILNLGETFEMLNIYHKAYACCRWAHAAIAGAVKLHDEMNSKNIPLASIQKILVRTFQYAADLSCVSPKNTEEAQYNLPFPVAAALLDGEVGPKQVLPPRLYDADILELAKKVETEVIDHYQAMYRTSYPSDVEIILSDGRILKSGTIVPKWDPGDDQATDTELEAKFYRLVSPVLGEEKAKKILELVWNLEKLTNINDLIEICCQ